jgi:hypothetical protein
VNAVLGWLMVAGKRPAHQENSSVLKYHLVTLDFSVGLVYGPIYSRPKGVVILNVSSRHGGRQRGKVTQARILILKLFGGTVLHHV